MCLLRIRGLLTYRHAIRRALVPFHKDLRLAGLLPPVDAPHHMRVMEWKSFREGVVLRSDVNTGSFIDVGLYETVRSVNDHIMSRDVCRILCVSDLQMIMHHFLLDLLKYCPLQEAHVSQALQPGMRVTLHMGASPDNQTLDDGSEVLNAQVVSPDEPRRSSGLYWGATTRIARGISAVFSECPYEVCGLLLMHCECVAA